MYEIRRRPTLLAALLLLFFLNASGKASRPYTVEDMLRTEGIGKVRFDPAGRYLIFERYRPFAAQPDFRRRFVPGELRSNLFIYDLNSGHPPTPLFDQAADNAYTLLSISPEGRHIAFLRASANGIAAGAYDVTRRRQREFGFSVGRTITAEPRWISSSRVAFPASAPGYLPDFFSIQAERVDQLVERWRQVRRGREPTASLLGSGRFAPRTVVEGSLVIADAAQGEVATLGAGNFPASFPSPDGRALAALRTGRLIVDANQRIEHGANIGGVQRALILYDLGGSGRARDLCGRCDVLQSSVSWSPSGRYLSFFARNEGQSWSEARFHIHDRARGATRPASLGTLSAHIVRRELDMNVGSAWLGNRFAVRVQPEAAAVAGGNPQPHWYLLEVPSPVNLSAAFGSARAEVVASSTDRLIMLSEGEAWAVDARGGRSNLTDAIAAPVDLWRPPHAHGPVDDLSPVDTIVLVSRASPDARREIHFVSLATSEISTVAAPSAGTEILAVSPATRQVAFLQSSNNVGTLLVADSDRSQAVAAINRHLADVSGGRPVRIDHRGPDGSPRMSWLLLPPGHRAGERLPTVVSVYPGAGNQSIWGRSRPESTTPLNDHILAGRGYAVLYPSLPSDRRVPRDPLDGLRDSVLAAVDAAVAQGYVDPDRMAVQGHSFGGYAAAALIGTTDRFRAAVAQEGLYDLFSFYGQFDPRRRLSSEQDGLNLFGVSLLETGHGGLGTPPWRDAERYLRNSPISYVERVNTPIMLIHGDLDYVPISQAEEYFTALTRLNKDAIFVRYFGEDHVINSPANIRDMWARLFAWYEQHLGPPVARAVGGEEH